MKQRRRLLRMLLWLLILLIAFVHLLGVWSWRRPVLGVTAGRLRDCPASPNAVSSQAPGPLHRIEPLVVSGDPNEHWQRLQQLLQQTPRLTIIEQTDAYLRAEAVSFWFRFADDLEFVRDPSHVHVDVRAAARVGHSDLGVNRRRIEALRRQLR